MLSTRPPNPFGLTSRKKRIAYILRELQEERSAKLRACLLSDVYGSPEERLEQWARYFVRCSLDLGSDGVTSVIDDNIQTFELLLNVTEAPRNGFLVCDVELQDKELFRGVLLREVL